jgi:hypothetical protein
MVQSSSLLLGAVAVFALAGSPGASAFSVQTRSTPYLGESTRRRTALAVVSEQKQQDSSSVVAADDTTNSIKSPPSISNAETLGYKVQTMDEGIFGFNKKLIDTVYDIVCFLYPVKGTGRDFARFFVLETVARVPYFGA